MLAEMSWVHERLLFDDSDDPLTRVALEIERRDWRHRIIGVETDSHFLLPARLQRLQASLPEARFINFAGHMWTQRLLKSALEIDYLRRCSAICDQATLAGVAAAGVA